MTPDDPQAKTESGSHAAGRLIAGRYRLERRLGGGGMAEVYLATDTTLERLVAVKVLRERFADDAQFVARFHREARAAAALNHPNVVAIHDRGGAAGSSFIVMEYVAGGTVKELVQRAGPLAPAAARDIECELLAALQAAHERGIVHRDVTAQNLLLGPDGRVKVTDFGIAHFGSSALTSTGIVMGTSRYLSPEQARGEPTDERSDVYSAGVVLFEMLTGRLPFEGDNDLAIALRHASEPAPAPSDVAASVPPALDAIVGRALRKDPAERFATAREFADALRAAELGPGDRGAGLGAAVAIAGAGAAAMGVASAVAPPAVAAAFAPAGVAAAASPIAAARTAATQVAAVPAAAAPASREGTAVTRVAPSTPRAASPARRRRRFWVALAVVVLAVAVLGGWLGYRAWAGRALVVPAVVGLSRGQAVDALRHQGFVVHTAGGYSDSYARGFVMTQRPGSGATLRKGGTVRLVVSRGLLHPAVVSVLGMTSGQAATALRGQGFVPHRLWRHSSSVPVGQIVQQSPAPTTRLLRGSAVRYWVSLGPLKVRVPNVVGASQGSATDTLHAAGFTVAVKDTLGLGTFPGNVTKQAPAAGSRVARGGQITIWVAIF